MILLNILMLRGRLMRLNDILKDITYKCGKSLDALTVESITCDSRSAKKAGMFIAFRGYAEDGYKFIGDAVKNGAKFIISEKDFEAPEGTVKIIVDDTRKALPVLAANFYGNPSRKLKMVGVTGTNGKTTITYIMESILKNAGEEPGIIGTISHRVNGKAVPAKNTTPGPLELQAMFADMVRGGSRYAVMEVSSHALDQGRVDGIHFDAAIFTNITPEHLDYHKTIDEYFNAKVKIFGKLNNNGTAILNTDDPRVARLHTNIDKGRIISYGLIGSPAVRAEHIKMSLDGSSFDAITPEASYNINTRLVGKHNVSNILAAIAACESLKIGHEAIRKGVEDIAFVPGRFEGVDCGQLFKVFVDFAHTEDALRRVLGLIKEVSGARITTVFGCGGNRDRAKRPLMGRAACSFSDRVIITSDNPRYEDPVSIIGEIEKGVKGEFSNYEIEPDRFKAIGKALCAAEAGDIVLIAGKGHENYQIIKDKVMPFDDREVVKKILNSKKAGTVKV